MATIEKYQTPCGTRNGNVVCWRVARRGPSSHRMVMSVLVFGNVGKMWARGGHGYG
jgi:hypothetical protein